MSKAEYRIDHDGFSSLSGKQYFCVRKKTRFGFWLKITKLMESIEEAQAWVANARKLERVNERLNDDLEGGAK